MPSVELIFDPDCPNVQRAREALLEAFRKAGLPPVWTEWSRQASSSPAYVREYGSPTILVDGRDVAGVENGAGADCCRLYRDGAGRVRGAPPVEEIAAALLASGSRGGE